VFHAARGAVHQNGLALERDRLMLVRLKRVLLVVPQRDHVLPGGEQRHQGGGGVLVIDGAMLEFG
jgi:hypothetical protein